MNLQQAMRRAKRGMSYINAERSENEIIRNGVDQLRKTFSFLKGVSGRKLATLVELVGIESLSSIAKSHQSPYLFMSYCSGLLKTRNADL